MIVYSTIKDSIENLKANLARECVMKDKAARRILGMKIFRDWRNRKFLIAQRSFVKRILSRFDTQDAELIGILFSIGKISSRKSPSIEAEKVDVPRVSFHIK